eukprot:scaffold2556_cov425-Prasinococcus_capsulatus_cf.AAC.15
MGLRITPAVLPRPWGWPGVLPNAKRGMGMSLRTHRHLPDFGAGKGGDENGELFVRSPAYPCPCK